MNCLLKKCSVGGCGNQRELKVTTTLYRDDGEPTRSESDDLCAFHAERIVPYARDMVHRRRSAS